jgi:undecaprenyl-diphosphatase
MTEFLYSIDKSVFIFCNQTIANSFFDLAMPFLTDLNKNWYGLTLFGLLWALLMWKGGKKGRILGLLIIPLIVMSDQLCSNVIKNIFLRPRPCHIVNGIPVVEHIRLLVDCGSGFSFPSSHASNNFAVATLFSFYYRRWAWAWLTFATIIGFSRISVGVHYPSDVIGGALFGAMCAFSIIFVWEDISKRIPPLQISSRRNSISEK